MSIRRARSCRFLEAVEERSDGRIAFQVFPAEQLGKAADAVNMLQSGVADIVFMSTVYHSQELPATQFLNLPHGQDAWTTANIFWRATHQPGLIKDEWDANGITPLMVFSNPPSEFHSTDVPLDGPDALEGLRMRSPGETLTLISEAVGATAIDVASPDQYEALQRGVINSLNYTFSSWGSFKVDELLSHTTLGLEIYAVNPALAISRKSLSEMPEELQDVILETGREFSSVGLAAVLEKNDVAFDSFVANGLTVHEWSDEDRAWLADRLADVRHVWIEKATEAGLAGETLAQQHAAFRAAAEQDPKTLPAE